MRKEEDRQGVSSSNYAVAWLVYKRTDMQINENLFIEALQKGLPADITTIPNSSTLPGTMSLSPPCLHSDKEWQTKQLEPCLDSYKHQ